MTLGLSGLKQAVHSLETALSVVSSSESLEEFND